MNNVRMNEWMIKKINEVITNNKENARMNQKSDMVFISIKHYIMMRERMKDLINGFKDK